MRKIGIAFVGTGFIADYHLSGLKAVPESEVRAVVGRDAGKASALAGRFGIASASTDLDQVLGRQDIDAVLVATPDDTHEDIARRCSAAGKSVMLQKPMAADSAACQRIIDEAKRMRVDLQVSFMHRYFEEFVEARAMIARGVIGRITSCRMRNATPGPDWSDWFFKKSRVSGGVVHQLGVHGIDLLLLLGGAVTEVSGTTEVLVGERVLADGRTVSVENPDSAWASYFFRSGAVATHEMSMIEVGGCDRFRLEIYGTEGTIWLRSERGPLAVLRRGGLWETPILSDRPLGERQHRRWIDGLLGKAEPEETAEDALAGMRIAEALARSSAARGVRTAVVE